MADTTQSNNADIIDSFLNEHLGNMLAKVEVES